MDKRGYTVGQQAIILLADAVSTFLGLFGVILCLTSSFSLSVDAGALALPCLGYVLVLVLIAQVGRNWLRRLLWLPVILAGAGYVWLEQEKVAAGGILCLKQIGEVAARSLGGANGLDLTALLGTMTASRRQEAVMACAIAFLLLYGFALGWIHLRLRSFWITFLATFFFPALPLIASVTPGEEALTALLLFWGSGLFIRLFAKEDLYGGAKATLLGLPLGGLLLWGVGLAVPREDYRRPEEMSRLRGELVSQVSQAGQTILSGGALSYSGTTVDLSSAGPRSYTGQIHLQVTSQSTGRVYLRGASCAVYTGERWEQLSPEDYAEMREGWVAPSSSLYDKGYREGVGDWQPINFPALFYSGQTATKYDIEHIVAGNVVFTPYQLATIPENMTGGSFEGDAYLAREMGYRRYTLYAREGLTPQNAAAAGEVGRAELAYREFVREHYLQVPQESSAGLTRLALEAAEGAVWSGQGEEALKLAQLVADYLAERCRYDLETPQTPEGEDFALWFLEGSRRGYCVHFATAGTLLLRSLGVPARYVTGYTAVTVAGQRVDVPDGNAHAWVEVYVDGYGWHPVEMTPGASSMQASAPVQEAESSPTPTASPSPAATRTPAPAATDAVPTAAPSYEETAAEEERMPAREEKGGAAWGIWWILGAAALAGFLPLRREVRRRKRDRAFRQEDPNAAVVALYCWRQELLAFAGREEEDEEVLRLAKRAKFSQHTLTAEERGYVENRAREAEKALQSQTWRRRVAARYLAGIC